LLAFLRCAAEALTDDVARENWEKYGNPDGKQSFEFSIGLPTFLADKGNHNLILLFYLVLMVVVVPSVVWAYWRDSQM
jgi:translocation protein SEC63